MTKRSRYNNKKKKIKKNRQLEDSTMTTRNPDDGIKVPQESDNPIPPEPDPKMFSPSAKVEKDL
ncbi:MAG: hypothetical protein P1Q69_20915, partial [Candidatus Thorarchaeota archaeon]|nr:hypothetical protein [Candidatus Thorarchaeota archaeon]